MHREPFDPNGKLIRRISFGEMEKAGEDCESGQIISVISTQRKLTQIRSLTKAIRIGKAQTAWIPFPTVCHGQRSTIIHHQR